MKRISIDPITRLEGHGRIDLYLDDAGSVEQAYLVIPELRGFEKFLEGRPVEELPLITQRICGVCPEAHHAAAAKATDAVYGVEIPYAAQLVRRLQYNAFMAGDHATHFFALGGPDFIMGPDAPPAERNVIGVLRKVGPELAGQVIRMRREAHEVAELLGGRRIHPVSMVPGGVSQPVSKETAARLAEIGAFMVEFSRAAQSVFARAVKDSPAFASMVQSEEYTSRTCYLALVNDKGQADPYDGNIRVVGPDGNEIVTYPPADYLKHFAERSEPWSYLKFPYLKSLGWHGTGDDAAGSIIRTGPLGGGASNSWYAGIASDIEQRLFTDHGVVRQGRWAHHTADTVEVARAVEAALLKLGCDGGTGGGANPRTVYVYWKTGSTIE